MSDKSLRDSCDTFFHGHRQQTAAQSFSAMAAWCEARQIAHDHYGEGELIQSFENEVAALCGFPAGLFCMTGTMAQLVALQLACQNKRQDVVGLHASAHLLLHENSNYQFLRQFKTLTIGEPFRPWLAKDLHNIADPLGAVLYELPMREIGAQMPSWQELDELKAACQERDVHLHMDGARLWEAATAYDRPLAQVCAGFDTCYVSFYKGIGGLGGAMLLGSQDFIARAKLGIKRLGGNIVQRSPYVVAAAMQLQQRLADMPRYLARTHELYHLLAQFPSLRVNPERAHCNMLHLYLPASVERCHAVRDQIAKEEKAWLFGLARNTALPQQAMVEWYVGDNLLALPLPRIEQLLQRLVVGLAEA